MVEPWVQGREKEWVQATRTIPTSAVAPELVPATRPPTARAARLAKASFAGALVATGRTATVMLPDCPLTPSTWAGRKRKRGPRGKGKVNKWTGHGYVCCAAASMTITPDNDNDDDNDNNSNLNMNTPQKQHQ